MTAAMPRLLLATLLATSLAAPVAADEVAAVVAGTCTAEEGDCTSLLQGSLAITESARARASPTSNQAALAPDLQHVAPADATAMEPPALPESLITAMMSVVLKAGHNVAARTSRTDAAPTDAPADAPADMPSLAVGSHAAAEGTGNSGQGKEAKIPWHLGNHSKHRGRGEKDIFSHHEPSTGDEGWAFFSSASPHEWTILFGTCVALVLMDFFLLRKLPSNFTTHMLILCFWVVVALAYNTGLLMRMGEAPAVEWFSGYLLEWMLSMDNLFIFHLVFTAYKTPADQIHKAVFVGIIGAVGMRMLFFMVLSTLLHLFGWMRFPFGLLLVWSGVEAAQGGDDDDDENVSDTMLVRCLKSCLGSRLVDRYDSEGKGLFLVEDGRVKATLLLVVVIVIELSDVLFALDSVSAKVAQIPQQYIAFSSSVLAMFGLRTMFFVIQDLVEMFDMLKYGLCMILIFIGMELMLDRAIVLPASSVCLMIFTVFAVSILASVTRSRLSSSDSGKGGAEEALAEAQVAIK